MVADSEGLKGQLEVTYLGETSAGEAHYLWMIRDEAIRIIDDGVGDMLGVESNRARPREAMYQLVVLLCAAAHSVQSWLEGRSKEPSSLFNSEAASWALMNLDLLNRLALNLGPTLDLDF